MCACAVVKGTDHIPLHPLSSHVGALRRRRSSRHSSPQLLLILLAHHRAQEASSPGKEGRYGADGSPTRPCMREWARDQTGGTVT